MSCIRRLLSCFIFIVIACLLLSAAMLFSDQVKTGIGNFLIVQDNLYPADVIHVIAGADYRTEYAIQLYQQGFARKIFFTGGWCDQHGYFHGEHGMQLALEAGIPPEDIAYDDSTVMSTYDETLLLQKYLETLQPPAQSIIVVSDPFHMRRARWTNEMVFKKGMNIIMQPVPFDQTPFKQQWWEDDDSRSFVKDEYTKMVYYYFRYQLGWKWLAYLDRN
jgi:uncharacterized SAM-binding protein YcdF (DUF218 family)